MSMARRGFLRAAVNRRILFQGNYTMTTDYIALDEVTYTVLSRPKASTKAVEEEGALYRAGTVLEIATVTKVKAFSKLLHIKFPAELYDIGAVSGQDMIDESEGYKSVKCIVHVHRDTDLATLSPFKIYVEMEA